MAYKEPKLDKNGAIALAKALGQANDDMIKKNNKKPAAKKKTTKK